MRGIFERRFSKDFNLSASYVGMKAQKWDAILNEFDLAPTSWITTQNARPHRVTASGIYQLPYGKGRAFLQNGVLSHIAGGWQLASTYEWQSGPLLDWGNLFYYGNSLNDIMLDSPTFDKWFNTDAGFEKTSTRTPVTPHVRVFPTRIDGLRADGVKLLNGSISKDIPIGERFKFQMRLDATNVLNRSHFGSPGMDPALD